MPPVTFESFDPTPYQRAPRINLVKSIALGRALLAVGPAEPPELVRRAAAKLGAVLDEADGAVDERLGESLPTEPSGDVALDGLADGLWAALRNRLEAIAGLDRDDLPRLAEGHGPRSAIARAVATMQDQAARARALQGRLFGSTGLAFTKAQLTEQAQLMASILRNVDKHDLSAEIEALAGSELLLLLRTCQPLYEAMVQARLTRSDRQPVDLGRVRSKVQRALGRYTNAVLAMLDDEDPDSLAVVLMALRPIDAFRPSRPSPTTNDEPTTGEPETPSDDATTEPPALATA